jgi:predicted phage replisome organizer
MERRYYWLRLKDDFFTSKRIKKLRRLAGGDTYTIIYLKMQLLSLKHDGVIQYSGLETTFADELALDLDEAVENVQITLQYLMSCGLVETSDNVNFILPYAVENTGSEGSSAKRMRELRARTDGGFHDLENPDIVTMCAQSDGRASLCDERASHRYGEIEKEKEIEKRDRDRERDKDRDINISCAEQQQAVASAPPVITIPLNDGSEYPISEEQIREWSSLYPAVDVNQQLRSMRAWSLSNPKKKKTKLGVKRFINSWLSKEQDRFHPSQNPQRSGNGVTFMDIYQREYGGTS